MSEATQSLPKPPRRRSAPKAKSQPERGALSASRYCTSEEEEEEEEEEDNLDDFDDDYSEFGGGN
jgi:hypothetical protein